MTEAEIFDKVKEIVVDQLDVDEADVTLAADIKNGLFQLLMLQMKYCSILKIPFQQ